MSRKLEVVIHENLLKSVSNPNGSLPENWWGGLFQFPVIVELLEIRGEGKNEHDKIIITCHGTSLASIWGEVGSMKDLLDELRIRVPFGIPDIDVLLKLAEWVEFGN